MPKYGIITGPAISGNILSWTPPVGAPIAIYKISAKAHGSKASHYVELANNSMDLTDPDVLPPKVGKNVTYSIVSSDGADLKNDSKPVKLEVEVVNGQFKIVVPTPPTKPVDRTDEIINTNLKVGADIVAAITGTAGATNKKLDNIEDLVAKTNARVHQPVPDNTKRLTIIGILTAIVLFAAIWGLLHWMSKNNKFGGPGIVATENALASMFGYGKSGTTNASDGAKAYVTSPCGGQNIQGLGSNLSIGNSNNITITQTIINGAPMVPPSAPVICVPPPVEEQYEWVTNPPPDSPVATNKVTGTVTGAQSIPITQWVQPQSQPQPQPRTERLVAVLDEPQYIEAQYYDPPAVVYQHPYYYQAPYVSVGWQYGSRPGFYQPESPHYRAPAWQGRIDTTGCRSGQGWRDGGNAGSNHGSIGNSGSNQRSQPQRPSNNNCNNGGGQQRRR